MFLIYQFANQVNILCHLKMIQQWVLVLFAAFTSVFCVRQLTMEWPPAK